MRIYHYTSIGTLALILQNKTIRFNRTDHVDDPDEVELSISGLPFSKFIFASCWTKDSAENIPQWNMYGDKSLGVRICLESDHMFCHFFDMMCYDKTKHDSDYIIDKSISLGNGKFMFPFPFASNDENQVYIPYYLFHGKLDPLTSGMCIVPPAKFENFFVDVEYVEDVNKSYPDCFHIEHRTNAKTYNLRFTPKIGFKKQKNWDFQQEVRFIIMMMHTVPQEKSSNFVLDCPSANFIEYGFPPINERREEMHFYDIELDSNAFDYLEVTMGPETTYQDFSTVTNLLRNHAPNSILRQSTIRTNFNRK